MRRHFSVPVGWLLLGAAALPGCVSEGPPPRAEPQDLPQQPVNLQPSRMAFYVSNQVLDSDNNGYADQINAAVYIFADNYPIAIAVPGSLRFTLSDRAGKVLAQWSFDKEQTAMLAQRLPPGPGYVLRLSLADVGSDKLESQTAEISGDFTPESGAPLRAKGTELRVGRLR